MAGEYASTPQAAGVLHRDAPTCRLTERLGEVRQRVRAAGWAIAVVVNDKDIVLGRLQGEAWQAAPDSTVEAVMDNGPATFRPDSFLEALVRQMRAQEVESVVITNSDGGLMGIVFRQEAERFLNQRLELNRAGVDQ